MRPITEIPGCGWLERFDPKLAIYDPWEVVGGFFRHHSTQRLMNFALQESDKPVEAEINELIESVAATSPFTFVQIGAHNGQFEDPFLSFLEKYDWNTLLVEPQLNLYAALSGLHSDRPNVAVARTAIGEETGQLILWRALHRGYGEFGQAIASPDREQVEREVRRCLGNYMMRMTEFSSETVPCTTLAELFVRYDIDPKGIDLFATDTEGFDATIVKQLLDMGAEPPAIHYEHYHVAKQQRSELEKRLTGMGYQMLRTHKDTFAHQLA